jgi:hypothetical protein
MVRLRAIANPKGGGGGASRGTAAEQGVGRGAMPGGFVTMGPDPGDFGFEKSDARVQFVLRIRRKVLGSEPAGGISFGPWQVVFFHFAQHRKLARLLSMRLLAIRRGCIRDRGRVLWGSAP